MPKRTLALIEKLKALGLTNARFRLIHHQGGSLHGHVQHCEKYDTFAARNNELVRDRLEWLLEVLSFKRQRGAVPNEGESQAAIMLAWNRYPFG